MRPVRACGLPESGASGTQIVAAKAWCRQKWPKAAVKYTFKRNNVHKLTSSVSSAGRVRHNCWMLTFASEGAAGCIIAVDVASSDRCAPIVTVRAASEGAASVRGVEKTKFRARGAGRRTVSRPRGAARRCLIDACYGPMRGLRERLALSGGGDVLERVGRSRKQQWRALVSVESQIIEVRQLNKR